MKTARNITLVSLFLAGVFTVPAYAHDWLDRTAVKGTATFTESNQHGLDFAAAATSTNSDYVQFVGVKEELDWALGLEYRLDNDTRLFMDYDHFDADQDSRFDTVAGGQRNLFAIDAGGDTVVSSVGEFDLNTYAFKLGTRHRLKFGPNYNVDLGAALSWLSVDRDLTVTQSSAAAAAVGVLHEDADFDGFGPFFDVSAKYYMKSRLKGFNLQAYVGAGLLYSETNYTATLTRTGGGIDREVFDREKVKGVASEAIMKLALGWDYCFSNRSMLSTSLGYMIQHYSDVFDYGAMGGAYSVLFANSERAGSGSSSANFPYTRQGPFLEFKWSGMGF